MKLLARGALGSIAAGALIVSTMTVPAFADPELSTPESPSKIVNTFIGTEGQGNTYPGATAPFGMTQVTPTAAWFPGYAYTDTTIYGFSTQSVSGAGCWEQGGVLPIMPTTGKVGPGEKFNTSSASTFNYGNYGSKYTHEGEVGQAGYYRTQLTDYGGINVETTATERVGFQRYTFPATTDANIFFNVGQANGVKAPNQWMKMKVHQGSVSIDEDGVITGWAEAQGFCTNQDYKYRQYFASKINVPVKTFGTWDNSGGQAGRMSATKTSESQMLGAWATIDTTQNQQVEVVTAISYTSTDSAKANLAAEGLDTNGNLKAFDTVKAETQAKWDDLLTRVRAYGGSSDDQTVFYSALYRALLQPSLGTDADGSYFGFDKKVHVADGWNYYQYFSLWDVFRTQNQLVAAFYPEISKDLGRSVLAVYAQDGWLMRWAYATYESGAMSGDPVSAYLADMWRYGVIDEDEGIVLPASETMSGKDVPLNVDTAYEALMKNVDEIPPAASQFAGRAGNPTYLDRGFIVHQTSVGSARKGHSDDREFAGSATLEYAVSDCAIAVMNDSIGTPENARRLADRAGNWKNIWNTARSWGGFTGFPNARTATGWTQWNATQTGTQTNGFEEATSVQYQYLTWQDAPGWTKMVGGTQGALERLDSFFSTSKILDGTDAWKTLAKTEWVTGALDYSGAKFNPNNEPDMHAPMYYSYLDNPMKTSAINRAAMKLFTNGSTGVTGNDDLGTMSAWHVFNSIGMYPNVAGTGEMILSSPRFEKIEFDVRDGETFTINAPGASGEKMQFIDSVTLNGDELTKNWITIEDVLGGGEMNISLTESQDTTWGTGADDGPFSQCSSEIVFRGTPRSVAANESLTGDIGVLAGPSDKLPAGFTVKVVWSDDAESALETSNDLARDLSLATGTVTDKVGTRTGTVVVSSSTGTKLAEFPYSYEVTESSATYDPVISVDPSEVVAGAEFTVSGSGFAPNEDVSIQVGSAAPVSIKANESGAFTKVITAPSVPGTVSIKALGSVSATEATASITVTPMTYSPTIKAEPETVGAGVAFAVNGTGFAANEDVSVTVGSSDPVVVKTDASGNFRRAFNAPVGTHSIKAIGAVSQTEATASVTVNAATYAPAIVVNPDTVRPNGAFAVKGTGFAPFEDVALKVGAEPEVIVKADAAGGFVRALSAPTAAGGYLVSALGAVSDTLVKSAVTVTAPTYAPRIEADPNSVPEGSAFAVRGTLFAPFEQVTVTIGSAAPVVVQADAAGSFTRAFTAPVGLHQVVAKGAESKVEAKASVVVLAPIFDLASITVNPLEVEEGEAFAVTGEGFRPQEVVEIRVGDAPSVSVTTDVAGGFTKALTAPVGTHDVIATGTQSKAEARSVVTVLATIYNPKVTVTSPVETGERVLIKGSGYAPNETVTVVVGDRDPLTFRADAAGSFTGPFVAPETAGEHEVIATGDQTLIPAFTMLSVEKPVIPPTDPVVERISGANRYATSLELLKAATPGRPVFVATGTGFADALSAAPAAAKVGGSVVLSNPKTLSPELKDALIAFEPAHIYVVGGKGAISASIEKDLGNIAETSRLSGSSRYATSLAIYDEFFKGQAFSKAFVATGQAFPDALAASSAAGALGGPVVLVNGKSTSVPAGVTDRLKGDNVQMTLIAGGKGAVSSAIENALKAALNNNVERLSGANRLATAVAINSWLDKQPEMDTEWVKSVYIATGWAYPDALSAAAPAGHPMARLVLSNKDCLPAEAVDAIKSYEHLDTIFLIGGQKALTDNVGKLKACD